MASVLEKLEPKHAADVLAGLIERLTPQPHEIPSPDPLAQDLLKEFRERLKLGPEDTSHRAIAKILPAITREFTALLLDKEREDRARWRLGARGDLPLRNYLIEFGEKFRKSEYRAVHKAHALDVIQRPDKFDHFGGDSNNDFPRLSIFAKYGRQGRDPSLLLILCSREGSKLKVEGSYRFFPSDIVDFDATDTTLGWLRSFVNKYGVPFFVNDAGPFKFLSNEVVVGPELRVRVDGPPQLRVDYAIVARPSPLLGVVHLALGYVIDTEHYLHDLRRHGVPVRTPKKP